MKRCELVWLGSVSWVNCVVPYGVVRLVTKSPGPYPNDEVRPMTSVMLASSPAPLYVTVEKRP